MARAIGGLLAGVVIASGLFLGPLSWMPSAALSQEGPIDEQIEPTDLVDISGMAADTLQDARSEFEDEGLARFYDTLVAAYQLDDDEPIAVSDNLTVILPDASRINYQAMTLPLIEAGKTIRDDDLRTFYYGYLARAGLYSPAGAEK